MGRPIDAIDRSPAKDRTAIVITSDHGEAFGEHGMLRHGFELWEELIWVPLIVYLPGLPPRKVGWSRRCSTPTACRRRAARGPTS
ncbi:MAG: sulfatase-like hydrolase/transferase [Myxococcales bacterium]|nr:sulfatase-like hydrolase/transferase [Myxococcales bacterium]